jgi:hypothetical protein
MAVGQVHQRFVSVVHEYSLLTDPLLDVFWQQIPLSDDGFA